MRGVDQLEHTRTCGICGDTLWVGDLFDRWSRTEAVSRADYVLERHERICRLLTPATDAASQTRHDPIESPPAWPDRGTPRRAADSGG